MKKIYVWQFVTAGIILSANAQPFKKDDKLLGGSISANNTNSQGPNNSSTFLSISPSLGFFTKPNRITGFSLSFGTNLNQQHIYGASVYKQYWNNLGKNFYFIMQGSVSANYSSLRSVNTTPFGTDESHNKMYTLALNISPGLTYRINQRLVVDAFLANFLSISDTYLKSHNRNSIGNVVEGESNIFNFNSGLSGFTLNNVGFGFRYILK